MIEIDQTKRMLEYPSFLLILNKQRALKFQLVIFPKIPTITEYRVGYKFGSSDDYYMIKKGNELLKIPKPRNPLLELEHLGENLPTKPISDIKKEIMNTIRKELGD